MQTRRNLVHKEGAFPEKGLGFRGVQVFGTSNVFHSADYHVLTLLD